jgi:hypothetical protein
MRRENASKNEVVFHVGEQHEPDAATAFDGMQADRRRPDEASVTGENKLRNLADPNVTRYRAPMVDRSAMRARTNVDAIFAF